MTERRPLSADDALELADDLLRSLAPKAGDLEAVNAVMRHWLSVLGHRDLSLVCMATVRNAFGECMTPDTVPGTRQQRMSIPQPAKETT